jgi:hypothetical protein
MVHFNCEGGVPEVNKEENEFSSKSIDQLFIIKENFTSYQRGAIDTWNVISEFINNTQKDILKMLEDRLITINEELDKKLGKDQEDGA